MLPESLSTSRAVPPLLVYAAAAIRAARDAITAYEGLRIIASEINGEPGTIRSMLASNNRGSALSPQQIASMPTNELAQSISIDGPFQELIVGPDMTAGDVGNAFMAGIAEEESGRLAVAELDRRFAEGTAEEQQAIIDMMQARQLVTENDEIAAENQQRANAFNSTLRGAFGALGDLGAAFFGRERRSSDSAFVSMERHEYDYCCSSPLRIFGAIPGAVSAGATYLQAMFHALDRMLVNAAEGEPDQAGNVLVFDEDSQQILGGINDFVGLRDALTLTHGAVNSGEPGARNFFTYGNWVDSPLMRRGLGLIRRLVRTVRSANVTEVLRLTTGQTPPEFFVNLLERLDYTQLANVLREFIIVDMDLDAGGNPILDDPRDGLFFTIQQVEDEE